MNKQKLVSVIVPVYNAEKYLRRCIESILGNTYVNIELLLINDGSTDSSCEICDEYAINDSRVRVFHQHNQGVSTARNVGLENCTGNWVSFIDADDYVSPDYFDCDYSNAVDVIQKSYSIIYEDENLIVQKPVRSNIIKSRKEFLFFYVRNRTNALWDKIIRRDLIGNRRFDTTVKVGEDFLFFLSLIKDVTKYSFNDLGCYFYNIRSGSAMDNVNRNYSDRVKIMIQNINHINSILNQDTETNLRYSIIYQTYINVLYNYKKHLTLSDINLVKRYFQEMSYSRLYYVSNSIRIKLFLKKILVLLWK